MLAHPPLFSPLWLLVATLAVWRVASLVCYEAGPFELLTRLRGGLARVGMQRAIACFHCTALWLSAGVVLTAFELHPRSALLVLAVAGGASLLERCLGTDADGVERQEDDEH
jgi:hypothetical protein